MIPEDEVIKATVRNDQQHPENHPENDENGKSPTFTVIVSFHDNFITKVDRAYHVDCSYEEADHTVTTQMDVSQAPEMQLQGQVESPQCHYRIQTPNENGGGYVTNVKVGDTVEHKWICASENSVQEDASAALVSNFGLLVHDCFVDDGKGRKVLVVDSKGSKTTQEELHVTRENGEKLLVNSKKLYPFAKKFGTVGFPSSSTTILDSSILQSEKHEQIHETHSTKETSNVLPQQYSQTTHSHPGTFGPPTEAKFEMIPEDEVIKGTARNAQQHPENHPENGENIEFHTTPSHSHVALTPGDNSHLPGFGIFCQTANWRNLDGQDG
ncbi:cuticlin-1 [Ditylenchus destructor]|nr:cuticlin-1 [Ditylenchus destructor]